MRVKGEGGSEVEVALRGRAFFFRVSATGRGEGGPRPTQGHLFLERRRWARRAKSARRARRVTAPAQPRFTPEPV